jgi:cytochrome P450
LNPRAIDAQSITKQRGRSDMDGGQTAGVPFPGFSSERIDDAVVNPALFADEAEWHALFSILRRDDPLRYMEPRGFRPFWAVTKHADIIEIERQNDLFINDPRTQLSPIEGEEWVKQMTGGSHLLLRTLVHMDNPDHFKFRQMTQGWFMPGNLKKLEERVSKLAKEHVDHMAALGGQCDFVKEVAVWYPLRVILEILGVPRSDERFMLKLTQEIFGPGDPDVAGESDHKATGMGGNVVDLMQTVQEFYRYFGAITADRRANPKDDVASVIANGQIDGQPIGELEAMSYYIIVATAGHDTTSSTTAGGMLQLIQNPEQLAKLKANPELMGSAVEEMIRWVTPVKHFMRTATADYEMRGKTIKKGESLCLYYPSANRDEEAFDDPFSFKVDRAPNKQLSFGHGAHLCLGMHLARMEMKQLFLELLPRLDEIELAGTPRNTEANFVSGLKTLPIKYRMR